MVRRIQRQQQPRPNKRTLVALRKINRSTTVPLVNMLVCIVSAYLFLPRFVSSNLISNECSNIEQNLQSWIESGNFSVARSLAFDSIQQYPECKPGLIKKYVQISDKVLSTIGQLPNDNLQSFILNATKTRPHESSTAVTAKHDNPNCTIGAVGSFGDPVKEWDGCCSVLPNEKPPKNGMETTIFEVSSSLSSTGGVVSLGNLDCSFENPCCEFFPGSNAHLRLPALYEPAIRVRVSLFDDKYKGTTTLNLEQDGYLRLFDVSTILWPSGYLLAQCLANPTVCGIPEVHQAINRQQQQRRQLHQGDRSNAPIALELGTGIGAASTSFALHLQEHLNATNHDQKEPLILATDIAPHALALAAANANNNHASGVRIFPMNHTNLTSVAEATAKYCSQEVAVVFGSSLQALFHQSYKSDSILWRVLDVLLSKGNDDAVAVFVHTKAEQLLPPEDGSFKVVRRIGGERFSMHTRSGDPSDFELSVFKRAHRTRVSNYGNSIEQK